MDPIRDRTVLVCSGESRYGSGILLTDRLVLTCAHTLDSGSPTRIRHPRLGSAELACTVLHSTGSGSHDLDAALLLAEPSPLGEKAPRDRLRLGGVEADPPECRLLGYPQAQLYDAREGRCDHLVGRVLTATEHRRRIQLELATASVDDRVDGLNPLGGLSGGPVSVGSILLGIAVAAPDGRNNTRIDFVPLAHILEDENIRALWKEHLGAEPRLERVTRESLEDQRYEDWYRSAVEKKFRTRGVIGLDVQGRQGENIDLDPSYVVLRARHKQSAQAAEQPKDQSDAKEQGSDPQGVHALLGEHDRVLITGSAGSGKTTLISWLARRCASDGLDDGLRPLQGRIPLVVKLREVHAKGQTLPVIGLIHEQLGPQAPEPPGNWAHRVLENSRGLLLIDGLDEIPHAAREKVRQELDQWLDGRDVRCIVTSRPGAFGDEWTDRSRFTELSLQDMGENEIRTFVDHWYRAAHEVHRIPGDWRGPAEDLTTQIVASAELSDLAKSPLLCAALCALHRAGGRHLPTRLWDLLDRTLAMLLGRRDMERTVRTRVLLDDAGYRSYLQPIAAWMVRGGQQVISEEQAVCQIELVTPAGDGSCHSTDILDQLTQRTVLRASDTHDERSTPGSGEEYEFVHRTFQDFLAAAEIARSRNVSELLRNAREESWQEVIKLSSGHWRHRPALQDELVTGLLELGNQLQADDEAEARADVHILAASCAFGCDRLDDAVRDNIRSALAGLLPPAKTVPWYALGKLGLPLLDYLPDPEALSRDSADDLASVVGAIGGGAAMPLAARLAGLGLPSVGAQLADAWRRFPTADYARRVLARTDLSEASLSVYDLTELEASAALRPVREIWIREDLPLEPLRRSLAPGFRELDLTHSELTDLGFVAQHAKTLEVLWLRETSKLRDLSPLSRLGGLRRLHVEEGPSVDVSFLQHLPLLEELRLQRRADDGSVLQHVARPSRLEDLRIVAPSIRALAPAAPLPTVRLLTLDDVEDWTGLEAIAVIFPSLTRLAIELRPGLTSPLDLSPLQGRPDLKITVYRYSVHELTVRGHEPFGDRFRCHPPLTAS
ncbi:NACHT domain-containing protein [Streptomyces sp. NPDC002577]